ncbi:MAG: flavodoxin domain-containing protein [Candidatus Peribacteraceae bacterium]|nr:flavodoxin domain-containing protein [Candidatus Peribacteraceae bacterium]MDD5074509.1 flavodoxin domain-containing protein [Candidatus Peribacteraceae bacterium]
MASLHIIFATSTGHTEHVVDTLIDVLRASVPKLTIEKRRAESVKSEDLLKGDVLLLACGTWNTGGTEGQLNPHMHALLKEKAKDVDLQKKPCILVALGDNRYFYTARAMEHLMQFVTQHNGMTVDSLVIVNDPYGQEEKVTKWAQKLPSKVPALAS